MRTLTPDICVIGGGAAGLTVAAAAAGFGVDVVLVERNRMGGDCLNVGCVPSKALIAAARRRHAVADGARFGLAADPAPVDFDAVMAHVHGAIGAIAPHDSVVRFEGLGVTVLKETARFLDARTLEAGAVRVRARRFVVATGSVPAMPAIPGLADVPALTNESVFDLDRLPERLVVLGAGPIGCELGQAFRRLGAEVALVETNRALAREDPALADILKRRLTAEGVRLLEGTEVNRIAPGESGAPIRVHLDVGEPLEATHLLVAAGRTPCHGDLDLARAGVETGPDGVRVDRRMRTSNRRIFAIGDVTPGPRFTHVAGHQASLVVRQILFRMPVRFHPERMPRATYTDPELGQVGLTPEAARAALGDGVEVHDVPLSSSDRARTEGESDGLVRLVADKRGRVVGFGAVAPHAGELAAAASLAMAGDVRVKTLASFVAPYPTYAELLKAAGVAYYKERLTGRAIRTLVRVLARFG